MSAKLLTKIRKKEISWEIDRMRPYVVKYLIPKNLKVFTSCDSVVCVQTPLPSGKIGEGASVIQRR